MASSLGRDDRGMRTSTCPARQEGVRNVPRFTTSTFRFAANTVAPVGQCRRSPKVYVLPAELGPHHHCARNLIEPFELIHDFSCNRTAPERLSPDVYGCLM